MSLLLPDQNCWHTRWRVRASVAGQGADVVRGAVYYDAVDQQLSGHDMFCQPGNGAGKCSMNIRCSCNPFLPHSRPFPQPQCGRAHRQASA